LLRQRTVNTKAKLERAKLVIAPIGREVQREVLTGQAAIQSSLLLAAA
jgi:hypothetical protein